LIVISKKQRVNELVTVLVRETTYLDIYGLAKEMHLSKRSVFVWIKELNTCLDSLSLDGLQHLSQGGYFIPESTKNELVQHYRRDVKIMRFSNHERQDYIIWLLIQKEPNLSLIKLATRFSVSKNTIINDFKLISEKLTGFEIINTHSGKKLEGSESAQRKWVYKQIINQNQNICGEIDKKNRFDEVILQLKKLEVATDNMYSDDAFNSLSYYIVWLTSRMDKKNSSPEPTDITTYKDIPDDAVGRWCGQLLHKYGNDKPEEIVSLRETLLATQLQSTSKSSEIMKELTQIAKYMTLRFNLISGINLRSDDFHNALATHLVSTYYRIQYGVQYHHPNLNGIKNSYENLMQLTRYTIQPFERKLGTKISDDELALIAIYFGGEIRNATPTISSDVEVLVVCTSGIGTSRLLLKQLITHYPNIKFSEPLSLVKYQNIIGGNIHPSLIITTTNIKNDDYPVARVQAIPTHTDFKSLDESLHKVGLLKKGKTNKIVNDIMDIVTNYARVEDFSGLTLSLNKYFNHNIETKKQDNSTQLSSLDDLISYRNIQISTKSVNWKDAVKLAFGPLRADKSITDDYIKKVINLTQQKGPYMVIKEGVMLAHATPADGVNKLAMSILSLEQPVKIQTEDLTRTVKVIICLAPNDTTSHMSALTQLMKLMQNENLYKALMTTNTKQEIAELLNQVSQLG